MNKQKNEMIVSITITGIFLGRPGFDQIADCIRFNHIAHFKKETHAMRLYAHCKMRAGGRGCLCMARRTDALHASLSKRNAGCGVVEKGGLN